MIVGAKLVKRHYLKKSLFGKNYFLSPCGLHFFVFIKSPYYGGLRPNFLKVFFFRFEPENVLDMFLKLYVIVFQQINLDATRLSSTSN